MRWFRWQKYMEFLTTAKNAFIWIINGAVSRGYRRIFGFFMGFCNGKLDGIDGGFVDGLPRDATVSNQTREADGILAGICLRSHGIAFSRSFRWSSVPMDDAVVSDILPPVVLA